MRRSLLNDPVVGLLISRQPSLIAKTQSGRNHCHVIASRNDPAMARDVVALEVDVILGVFLFISRYARGAHTLLPLQA